MKRHWIGFCLPLLLGLFTACTHRANPPPQRPDGILGEWVAVDPEGTTQTITLLFDSFGRVSYGSDKKGDEQRALGKYESSNSDRSFKATIQAKGATLALEGRQVNDDELVVEWKSSSGSAKDSRSTVRFSRKRSVSAPGNAKGDSAKEE